MKIIKQIYNSLFQRNITVDDFKSQWRIRFIMWWNNLPIFLRYLIPNLVSLGMPSFLLYVESFHLGKVEVLGALGISHTIIKSLIIGYLKKLDYISQNNL